jgi:uncharacterized protein
MKRIGLLSDTHGFFDPALKDFFGNCDEIWHAGDIGTIELADEIESFKPFRAVYGNIDGASIRMRYPLDNKFMCEGIEVWITHIGGYPGNYDRRIKEAIKITPPGLFISGHSHICKVIHDKELRVMHFNPGAAGKVGFHEMRTALKFSIDGKQFKDMELIEIGKR